MKNQATEKRHKMFLGCDCNSHFLMIDYWEPEHGEHSDIFLSYMIPNYYALQKTILSRFKNAISMIWKIVSGQEFSLYEISLSSQEEIVRFKEFVAGIDETKALYE